MPSNENDELWVIKESKSPKYPTRMMKSGVVGCVNIAYIISSEGEVVNPVVIKKYPGSGFDNASLKAIRGFKYTPTEKNRERLPARHNNVFTFEMSSKIFSEKFKNRLLY